MPYMDVFLQHPGSDDSVWKDLPVAQRMAALKKAAGRKDFKLRVQDVPVVLDHLPGEREWRNPNHRRAVLAVTTAF